MDQRRKTSFFSNLRNRHRVNRENGVYGYMGGAVLKIILIYFATIVPIVLLIKHFVDLQATFVYVTEKLPDYMVWVIFFLSESLLGMIPPDLFVIWSVKFYHPFQVLFFLGILSYAGSIISYLIGRWLSMHLKFKAFSEKALDRYIRLVRKWGGAFIVIAALFPFTPFSMIVIALSLLKYPPKSFLLFGLARITRFVMQGFFYLNVMNLQTLVPQHVFHLNQFIIDCWSNIF